MGQLSSMILWMTGPSITKKVSRGDFLSPYPKTPKSRVLRRIDQINSHRGIVRSGRDTENTEKTRVY
jgi:hypothetical protein